MRRLCLCALGFAGALLACHYALPHSALLWCAAGLICCCLAALFFRGNNRTRMLIVCVSAALGFGWYYACEALLVKPCEALAGQERVVSARVSDYPEALERGSRVDVVLTGEGMPAARTAIYDYNGLMPELRPGDIIRAELRFSSATQRRGEETDSFIAAGVTAVAYLLSPPEVVGRAGPDFLYLPQAIGRAIRDGADAVFPQDTRGYMKGMLIGEKRELYADDTLYAALSRSGILHVAAVSGMHLSFIYGFVRFAVRSRKKAAALSIPLLWLFALVAGATPSALRAAIMLTLVIAAPFLRRETDGPTSLCAALLPLLIANPFAIGSAGLQLSFAAMAGIVLVSPRVRGWCEEKWRPPEKGRGAVRRTVISGLASSVGAAVFVSPVAALRFGYVSLVSPLTFLLTLPVLSLCFIGGYAAVLLGLVWTPLGAALGWCVSWLARYIALACEVLSALPFAAVYTSDLLIALWLLLTFALFLIAYLRRGRAPFRPLVPLCLSIITLCSVMSINTLYYNGQNSAVVLDVGQGQSIALFSGPSTVVVDCGGDGDSAAGDVCADFLQSRGRTRVDALVLTHLHRDHAGGVTRLLARMNVKYLFLPFDVPDDDGLLPAITAMAARRGTKLVYISEDTDVSAGEAVLKLFAPLDAGEANERGLIALISAGTWDMMVTGDVNASVERRLAERYVLSDCEAFVVGHHGSKRSTCIELLSEIQAETALISVGYNTYGHPTQETLELLEHFGMNIYRTDRDGSIILRIERNG